MTYDHWKSTNPADEELGSAMENRSEANIQAQADAVIDAAHVLIGIVLSTEHIERGRTSAAELSLDIELESGGVETWKITIERTASSH
jgi:hypothetical protein